MPSAEIILLEADNSPSISAPGVRLAIRAPKIMHRPQILSHRSALGGTVMKAAVVPAVSSSWQIKDVPQPQPGPNQVLVKMHASGICYTDVHLTLGHFPGLFPRILGHEPVARSLPWLPTSPRER